VFTLPKVSSKMKLKVTAVDGSRVRRVGVAWFGSSRTEDYGESGLVFLTNQGDVHVLSLPHVKMQVRYPCIRREDVSGIASCVFTKQGQGKHSSLSTYCLIRNSAEMLFLFLIYIYTQYFLCVKTCHVLLKNVGCRRAYYYCVIVDSLWKCVRAALVTDSYR
ncbi:Lethal(2) giant larvae protein 2, partial [Xenotaenia resolanae]